MPDTALDTLKLMTAWDSDPALNEDELSAILASYSRADPSGNSPADGAWTPTYDINAAAANAWLIKAGRASMLTEVDPPGSGIVTSKVFDNCRSMARIYNAKRRAAVSVR